MIHIQSCFLRFVFRKWRHSRKKARKLRQNNLQFEIWNLEVAETDISKCLTMNARIFKLTRELFEVKDLDFDGTFVDEKSISETRRASDIEFRFFTNFWKSPPKYVNLRRKWQKSFPKFGKSPVGTYNFFCALNSLDRKSPLCFLLWRITPPPFGFSAKARKLRDIQIKISNKKCSRPNFQVFWFLSFSW